MVKTDRKERLMVATAPYRGRAGGPSWQDLRKITGVLAKDRRQYAGMPMPIPEAALCVAKAMPFFERLNGKTLGDHGGGGDGEPKDDTGDRLTFVNSWFKRDEQRRVYVMHNEATGKRESGWLNEGPIHRVEQAVKCMGVAGTMDIEAERRAMQTLRGLLKPHMFEYYEMLGYFIETSKRSGVTYMFRRLKTTVAFRVREVEGQPGVGGAWRYLASLCLHPIAYYESLPIGAMVPTDDVIAHLVMMRSDEVMFWRKANQHDAFAPGAML